jgi:hypothetical protein
MTIATSTRGGACAGLVTMLACVQVSKEQAKQIEASIQRAFAKLSAWEDSVIHAKDLRSLAAVSLPQRLWDRPESSPAARGSGNMAVATPTRTGFAGQSQAWDLADVPTEDTEVAADASAALELLQQDVASAAACTLAPQGHLMFSSVMSAVIVRPHHVITASCPPRRNPHAPLRLLTRQAAFAAGGAIESVRLVSEHPPLRPPHGRHISLFSHVPSRDTAARKGTTAVLGIGEFPDDLAAANNLCNLQKSSPAWSRVSALHRQPVPPVHTVSHAHSQVLRLQ